MCGPLNNADRGRNSQSSLTKAEVMSILFVIIAIVAIVLAVTGGLVHAVSFLLWVGIVLLILAVIAFLIRSISGRSRV
jgi:quinol-cytochrome oxidoreductase complex cytochrome b subunit